MNQNRLPILIVPVRQREFRQITEQGRLIHAAIRNQSNKNGDFLRLIEGIRCHLSANGTNEE